MIIPVITIKQLSAQSDLAHLLKNNVIAIETNLEQGFGIVTGERNNKLYIATAAHILKDGDKYLQSSTVKFYDDHNSYTATKLKVFEELDLALLEVAKPRNFRWEQECSRIAEYGDRVSFVGRGWQVAIGDALGTVQSTSRNYFDVHITSVEEGISGTPLIAKCGMIGIVLSDDNSEIRAINMAQIEDAFSQYSYTFTIEERCCVTDPYGQLYGCRQMPSGQIWMTENLNYETPGSICYDDENYNCEEYGRLYKWEAARKACTELGQGWRLPNQKDWFSLLASYDGFSYNKGEKDGQKSFKELTNPYGDLIFLRSGRYNRDENKDRKPALYKDKYYFEFMRTHGFYWSGTTVDSRAWSYELDGWVKTLYRARRALSTYESCRCVKE